MIEILLILYAINGISFLVGDIFAYKGFEIMGPPYVQQPNPKNLILGAVTLPLTPVIAMAVMRDKRGHVIQFGFQVVYFLSVTLYYEKLTDIPWAVFVGVSIWMFLVRKATNTPKE